MVAASTVSIEVPCTQGNEWVTLTFYTTSVLAPNHEPIKIERAARFAIVASYQEFVCSSLTKLRFLFHKQKCHRQIQLKTFSHKKGAAKPNENALNLALLIADLHFAGVITLPEMSALEAGYCFSDGLISIAPCKVAPNNQQAAFNSTENNRSSLVYRFDNIEVTAYQANFDYQLLAMVKSIAPQSIHQSCVYYPMVDADQEAGHTLAFFTILFLPSESKSCAVIGSDMTFKFTVNEFVEQNIDLNIILNGHILIDCGSRPSKGHNSWQLALVTALQIVTGLMPCEKLPLICTGEVTRKQIEDNSRAIVPIGEAEKKYQFLHSLYSESTSLLSAFNQACNNYKWYFCLPEKNYYELTVKDASLIQVSPVMYWYYEDLIV